jgi:general secretion pathway protein K
MHKTDDDVYRIETSNQRAGTGESGSRTLMAHRMIRKRFLVRRERGFIVVAVLWIIMALASLVSVYAVYVVRTSYVIGAGDDRVNADALFTAAVELTAYRLMAVKKEERPVNGRDSFRMGRARIGLEFHSEGARIDLNAAPKELLSNLFVVLGAPPAAAEQYADRIIAWRTPGGAPNALADPEADAYRSAGKNYYPRRAPFQNADELWLVLGLPPALVERAMPYVTVFNGRPQVNVLAAPPVVVAALPGMEAAQVNEFLGARQSTADGQALLEALGPAASAATVETGKATRISVIVQFDRGRRVSAEIVIMLEDDAERPYRVLSWRDDFDQIEPIVR